MEVVFTASAYFRSAFTRSAYVDRPLTPLEDGSGRPHIVHFIDSLDVSGGAERQLIENLNHFDLQRFRHSLTVIKPATDDRRDEITDEVAVTPLFPAEATPSRVDVARAFRRRLIRAEPSLVHVALPNAALAARWATRSLGVPLVESLVNISHESVRTIDNPRVSHAKLKLHTLVDRVSMRRGIGFHAVSDEVARSWVDIVGIDRQIVRVIPRGVDVHEFECSEDERDRIRREVRTEFGFRWDSPIVLSVGRVEPQKGHRYLVEAVASVANRHPDVRLVIVGRAGMASDAVKSEVHRHSAQDIVVLAGARRDLRRLLAAADVFAFPSLFEGNGGNAMIEAMAASVPIVTTNAPPMTDLVPDDRHGMLVPRCDSQALAEAIEHLLTDHRLRDEVVTNSSARVGTFPDPRQVSEMYEDWYGQLLGRPEYDS